MNYIELIKKLQEERKGWADFRLPLYDNSLRWKWWSMVTITNQLPPLHLQPYPKLNFNLRPKESDNPYNTIERCCRANRSPSDFSLFLDWLLYKFGDRTVRDASNIPQSLKDHWEKEFDLKTLLDDPSDWLGIYYERNIISKHEQEKNGLFCTPLNVVSAMTEMSLQEADLLSSLNDPCVGSGRFLLLGSNYSLLLSGQDINSNMVKITQINGWLYMPSLVWPCPSLSPISTYQVSNGTIHQATVQEKVDSEAPEVPLKSQKTKSTEEVKKAIQQPLLFEGE